MTTASTVMTMASTVMTAVSTAEGLLTAGAGGLLLLAAPGTAYAGTSRTARAETGTAATVGAGPDRAMDRRRPVIRITQGTMLVHADMHNHTVMSDGDGDPSLALRLDARGRSGRRRAHRPRHPLRHRGLSSSEWDRTGALANAADDPGRFTAIRGFEWSHPLLGHINVWFTDDFADLLRAGSPG